MGIAKQPGGLYVVRGIVVDAEGRAIENAPPVEPDTVPSASGPVNPMSTMADQIAEGIARGLNAATAPTTSDAKK